MGWRWYFLRFCSLAGLGSATIGTQIPRQREVIARAAALLVTLVIAGLSTPSVTTWARTEMTGMRVVVSVMLLAPPAFCMGMMFPLGLNIWRRYTELLPFFWSANGVTSMFASVLGMALSIEFGIAKTYAIGVAFYAVCAFIIVRSCQANRIGVPALRPAEGVGVRHQEEVAAAQPAAARSNRIGLSSLLIATNATSRLSRRRELAQHVGQDAAVVEVIELVLGRDAAEERHFLRACRRNI